MSTDRNHSSQPDPADAAHDSHDEPRVPGVGDDERESREHLAATGEPKRDALGNADGAS